MRKKVENKKLPKCWTFTPEVVKKIEGLSKEKKISESKIADDILKKYYNIK